jgi:hypothetical protein
MLTFLLGVVTGAVVVVIVPAAFAWVKKQTTSVETAVKTEVDSIKKKL